jgi:hypothetical protein
MNKLGLALSLVFVSPAMMSRCWSLNSTGLDWSPASAGAEIPGEAREHYERRRAERRAIERGLGSVHHPEGRHRIANLFQKLV